MMPFTLAHIRKIHNEFPAKAAANPFFSKALVDAHIKRSEVAVLDKYLQPGVTYVVNCQNGRIFAYLGTKNQAITGIDRVTRYFEAISKAHPNAKLIKGTLNTKAGISRSLYGKANNIICFDNAMNGCFTEEELKTFAATCRMLAARDATLFIDSLFGNIYPNINRAFGYDVKGRTFSLFNAKEPSVMGVGIVSNILGTPSADFHPSFYAINTLFPNEGAAFVDSVDSGEVPHKTRHYVYKFS